jgi:probable F420-dependent oxidoreductase
MEARSLPRSLPATAGQIPRRGISVFAASIRMSAELASAADASGFESVWTSELYNRSASIPLAALAMGTKRCTIGSGIIYAVGRTPLMLAAEARDLDELSDGRLVLGLGNGTRRMISDWHGLDGDAPATRMEELVPLVRDLWRLGERPVDHEGRFYRVKIRGLDETVTRQIPIYTAGVNPRMIETAGRVADGLLGHSLFTPRYLAEVVRPALEKGARHADRDPEDVALATFVIASIGDDSELARRDAAAMIAFYGSVKTYAPLFDICGFGEEAEAIRSAFARGEVQAMIDCVTDEMIDEFAATGTAQQIDEHLRRFDGLVDRLILFPPSFNVPPERANRTAEALIDQCAPRMV